jgi:hypothetical protein
MACFVRRMHSVELGCDARGAVFVEKLIAYLPLMIAFFCTWELAELGAASLVVQRASSAAGRAAVVVLPDDPLYYAGEEVGSFGGARKADIELAAGMVLSSNPKLTADFALDVSDPPENVGPLDVTLTAHYACGIVSFLCGGDAAIELSATTTHTYQGARYQYTLPAGAALGGTAEALVGSEGGFRAGYRKGKSGAAGSANGTPGSHNNNGQPCGAACSKRGLDADGKPGANAKCRYLWRFDKRSPGEIFENGFSAKGTSTDLGAHVEGSQMSNSGYVSTTSSEVVAFKLFWQVNETKKKKEGCIYKIRDCGCGVDVADTLKNCPLPPDQA